MARPGVGAHMLSGGLQVLYQVEPRQRGNDADQPARALWRQRRHGRHERVQEGGRSQRGGFVRQCYVAVAYCTCMCASYLHARLDPSVSQTLDGGGTHSLPNQLGQLHVVGRFEDLRPVSQASRMVTLSVIRRIGRNVTHPAYLAQAVQVGQRGQLIQGPLAVAQQRRARSLGLEAACGVSQRANGK